MFRRKKKKQKTQELEVSYDLIKDLPEGYMGKYVTTKEAIEIINGNYKIKGSCIKVNHIKVPLSKKEKLLAIRAEGSEKFKEDPGVALYTFPFRNNLKIEPCTMELKPDWIYPFTGHGFVPVDYSIVPLYYLTEELTYDNGHSLFIFHDEGPIVEFYNYYPSSNKWLNGNQSEMEEQSIGKEKWIKLLEAAGKLEHPNNEILLWSNLFKSNWYGVKRDDMDGEPIPYFGQIEKDNKAQGALMVFTHIDMLQAYMNKAGVNYDDVLVYRMPEYMDKIKQYTNMGVNHITFNVGVCQTSFTGVITELKMIYDWIINNL